MPSGGVCTHKRSRLPCRGTEGKHSATIEDKQKMSLGLHLVNIFKQIDKEIIHRTSRVRLVTMMAPRYELREKILEELSMIYELIYLGL